MSPPVKSFECKIIRPNRRKHHTVLNQSLSLAVNQIFHFPALTPQRNPLRSSLLSTSSDGMSYQHLLHFRFRFGDYVPAFAQKKQKRKDALHDQRTPPLPPSKVQVTVRDYRDPDLTTTRLTSVKIAELVYLPRL